MTLKVESYAGYKGEERPVRFRLGEQDLEVQEILDRWYGPGEDFFKVKAGDGYTYILARSARSESWRLAAFRA